MRKILQTALFTLLLAPTARAGRVLYVDAVSGADDALHDGSTPGKAKQTLVAAMACAADGDTVCALPGTYDSGSAACPAGWNGSAHTRTRVLVPAGVRLVSRDGAASTFIVGERAPEEGLSVPEYGFGTNAVRCVTLSARTALEGFTLTGGHTWATGTIQCESDHGAAVWAYDASTCRIADCVLSNNVGAISGTCRCGVYVRCRIVDNRTTWYGMVDSARLYNCFLDGNLGNYVAHNPFAVVNCTFGPGNTLEGIRVGNATPAPVHNSLILCKVGQFVSLRNCLVAGTARENVLWKDGSRACASADEARRLAIDAGRTDFYATNWTTAATFETDGATDVTGGTRVRGRRLDIGAEEHDFRADFAEILLPNDARVTDVSDTAYPDGDAIVLPAGATMEFTIDNLTDDVSLEPSLEPEGACAADLLDLGDGRYRLTATGESGLLRIGRIRVVLTKRDPSVFPLAGIGRDTTIVVANETRKSTLLAAEELAHYVKAITGRDLTVTNADTAASRVIIGLEAEIPDLPAAARAALEATDNLEAGWTGTDGTNLWIVGKTDVAELYATYRFIERKLGVRWFKGATADDPGEWVPASATIEIPAFAEFRQPDFAIRRLDKCSIYVTCLAKNGESCAVRNGYHVPPATTSYKNADYLAFYEARYPKRLWPMGGGHGTFLDPMPTNTTFAAHPEYFGLYDGRRRCDYQQYCLTNPSVRSNAADYALARLNTLGDRDGTYLFGLWDDSRGQCECAACQALDPWPMYRYSSTPDITTRFVDAVNDMARQVWARRPESTLYLWAYLNYRKPPVGLAPDPRLSVQFCSHGRCYGHALDDANCPVNRAYCAWLREWCRLSPRVFTYEYYGCSAPHYCCHEMTEPRDLRFYKSLGMVGIKHEAYFSDASFIEQALATKTDEIFPSTWQHLYVTGHLLWDTTLDEFALLEDVESKYYGEAYPAMKPYHALRRSLWANNATCMGYPNGNARRPRLLDAPQSRERLLAYLDEAEALAANDPLVLRRLAADRDWLTRYWIAPFSSRSADGAMIALRRTSRIAVDGAMDDDAWSGGVAFTNLAETTVTALYDDDALYFFIRATAGGTADRVEIVLDPPLSNGLVRTSLVFNRDGTASGVVGMTAEAQAKDDTWQVEARVPAKSIFPLRDQDLWRLRLRRVRDGVTVVCDEGTDEDIAAYRPFCIGLPYLSNPAFRTLSDEGILPQYWSHVAGGTSAAVPFGSGYLLSVSNGTYAAAYASPLSQDETERPFDVTVRAHGTGTLLVGTLEYTDTYGPEAGYKYKRTCFPGQYFAAFPLQSESRAYEVHYVIPTNRWCNLLLGCEGKGSVLVESVALRPAVTNACRKTLRTELDACTDGAKLETYAVSGEPVTNGALRAVAVTGLTGAAAELDATTNEASVAELSEKLALPVPAGYVARPLVSSDGTLLVSYAEAPTTDGEDLPLEMSETDDGTVLSLNVANPVKGFWYGLLSADEPAETFDRDGAAVQHDGERESLRVEATPTRANRRFYRAAVWPLRPGK